jgi:hypothetical protein
MSESDNKESNSSMIFEIGKTVLKINDSSTALFRVRMK